MIKYDSFEKQKIYRGKIIFFAGIIVLGLGVYLGYSLLSNLIVNWGVIPVLSPKYPAKTIIVVQNSNKSQYDNIYEQYITPLKHTKTLNKSEEPLNNLVKNTNTLNKSGKSLNNLVKKKQKKIKTAFSRKTANMEAKLNTVNKKNVIWYVQLASLQTERATIVYWHFLINKFKIFNNYYMIINKNVFANKGITYTLMLGNFHSRQKAEALCNVLKKNKIQCFVKK